LESGKFVFLTADLRQGSLKSLSILQISLTSSDTRFQG